LALRFHQLVAEFDENPVLACRVAC
jgi:hypothetical protein